MSMIDIFLGYSQIYRVEALKAYDSEIREFPHSRSYKSVKYLAHWRGASVGVDSAEAFMLLRIKN